MDKTSKTMLNSSGESGHLCLAPGFRGNAFDFSPLRILFAVGLSHIAFIMLVCSFYSCFLETFYHKCMLNFVKAIPLLGIHIEEIRTERDTCTPMFTAALFVIARTWQQSRCPSASMDKKAV